MRRNSKSVVRIVMKPMKPSKLVVRRERLRLLTPKELSQSPGCGITGPTCSNKSCWNEDCIWW
jgi:hypothetical protein